MRKTALRLTLLALVTGGAADALAQGIPTSQPKFLQIFRESIKPGRAAEHAKWEAGWPAAFEKAKSKNTYIAISSLTGPAEAWYISPFASQAAYGESLADEQDPVLGPELERLSKGDAEFISDWSSIQAVAAPELSHGALPDISKVRFYQITTFRVKPGSSMAGAALLLQSFSTQTPAGVLIFFLLSLVVIIIQGGLMLRGRRRRKVGIYHGHPTADLLAHDHSNARR